MGLAPLTANFRIVFPYVCALEPHKLECYLNCVTSADPSGYNAVTRAGYTNVGVTVAMTRVWNILAPFFSSADASFGNATLYQRFGTVFAPVYTEANAVTPSNASATLKAYGSVFFQRATNRTKMPVYLSEWAFDSEITKVTSYGSLGAALKALTDSFMNAGGTALNSDAYAWRLSKDSNYGGGFVSWVNDTNEKYRRIRRIK